MKIILLSLLLTLRLCTGYIPAGTLENEGKKTAGASEMPEIYSSWNEAYQDFVCGAKFLTADFPDQTEDVWWGQPLWGTDSPLRISLRDLDLDGIPELIVSNGRGAALERAAYVYTFTDGRIEYIGVCMPDLSYAPGSLYSGVFCRFYAGSGTGSVSCCTKDGNTIREEMVYSYEWDSGGEREDQATTDNALYDNAKNNTVPL